MARSYRVAKYGGPTEAKRLSAGRGGRGSLKIPTGTPRFRVDMNWEEAQEKTAHQARVKALAAAGYDPKILANMSPEVTARLHAQMADDPIEAEQAKAAKEIESKGADALSDLLGLGLNFDKIDQEALEKPEEPDAADTSKPFRSSLDDWYVKDGDVVWKSKEGQEPDPDDDAIGPPADSISVERTIAEAEAGGAYGDPKKDLTLESLVPTLGGDAIQEADSTSKERNLANIYSIYEDLPDSLKEKFYPKFKDAMKEATPEKYDEWAAGKTYSAQVENKDGKNFYVTWDKRTGKEIGERISLPEGPVDWMEVPVWTKDGSRGFYIRDKDDYQNYKKGKDGKPKLFKLPDDATDIKPSKPPRATMKFNAFLEKNRKKYGDLVPQNTDGTPVLVDPVEFYKKTKRDTIERKAVVEFHEEDDLLIRMLQELNELKYGKKGASESDQAKKILENRKNKKIELPSTE